MEKTLLLQQQILENPYKFKMEGIRKFTIMFLEILWIGWIMEVE